VFSAALPPTSAENKAKDDKSSDPDVLNA